MTIVFELTEKAAYGRHILMCNDSPRTERVKHNLAVKFPYFLFLTWLLIIRNQEFRLYI